MVHDRPWKILLVEDDEDDYILTRALLSEARQGQDRLEWVSTFDAGLRASQSGNYDVCLIDYFLGERTGLELVRAIRASSSRTPLLLMTGQGSYAIDMESMRAGATDYLIKGDLSAWSLERAIRYAIDRKQAEDTLRTANEQLAQARDELEQRVQERTQELAQANQGLRAEIAERQRIETALRQSESRFRALAETTSSAIFIVRDMKILYANPAVKIITGFSPEELQGVDFWEIAHPTYRDVLKKAGLKPQWVDGVPARYELKLLTARNQERWVDVTTGRMEYEGRPALVVTAFDITDRDLAEQALWETNEQLSRTQKELEQRVAARTAELSRTNAQLEAERARLSTLITNAPVAIVMSDAQARIMLANPAADRIHARPIPLGQSFESLAALHVCYPDGTPYDPRDLPLIRSALDGEVIPNLELGAQWPDGQFRSLLASSAPIRDSQGEISGAVALFQDITPLTQASEEKRRDAAHIEVQRRLLQYQEQERLRLAQDLHDGPLQELIGLTFSLSDILQRLAVVEGGEIWLPKLLDAQERMKQQIRDLRLFCSDLRPPTLAPFGLEKAIRSHARSFQERHPELQVILQLQPDGLRLPENLRLSLFRIYQECLNNVARHAQAEEVWVRLRIDLDEATGQDQAILEVQDSGIGFQAPRNWVDMANLGHLGLVGVQERAQAVGGTVEIVSAPGEGARVRVTAPFEAREPAQVSAD